jgi:hypothetical protein
MLRFGRKTTWSIVLILLAVSYQANSYPFSYNKFPLNRLSVFYPNYSLFTNADEIMKVDSVIIPLKRAGRLMVFEATIEGKTGNMIFDTGANHLVFNSTYFRDHLKLNSGTSSGITGDVGQVEQILIEKIEMDGLTFRNTRADLANLGHLETRKGIKIMGLFGFSMIKNLEVVIDHQNNLLKLYKIDKTGNRTGKPKQNFVPDYIQKIETYGNILYLSGTIGGKNLKFCFDTGAETNVICSKCPKNIMNTLTITRRSKLSGTGAVGSEVLFGKMNDFSFGGKDISGMETIITNLDALSEAYGTKIDGMLGYNFLASATVCVNFVKKEFGIKYNKVTDQ